MGDGLSKLEQVLRSKITWILIPIIAYLISFSWLSLYALAIPYVLMGAPMGFFYLLFKIDYEKYQYMYYVSIVLYYGFFGTLYIYFFRNIKKLNKKKLYTIAIIIILILILTLRGCSTLPLLQKP